MKTLVVFQSISGFTKKYASWIAEELHAHLKKIDEIDLKSVSQYDLFIFGGSLHAIGINGYKEFRIIMREIGFDKIILFAVGASPSKDKIEDEIRSSNFFTNEEMKIPFFYLRGGFNFNKLDFRNKVLMKLLTSVPKLVNPEIYQ